MRQSKSKLEIRERRIFSEELKKKAVKDLVSKRTTIRSLMIEHQISANTVYRWLYRYSPHHDQKCTLVVQMKSEESKNSAVCAYDGTVSRDSSGHGAAHYV